MTDEAKRLKNRYHNWVGDPKSTGGEYCSRCGVGRIGTPDDGCWGGTESITPSCGCVFCDIDLKPDSDGFHELNRGKDVSGIPCPIHEQAYETVVKVHGSSDAQDFDACVRAEMDNIISKK